MNEEPSPPAPPVEGPVTEATGTIRKAKKTVRKSRALIAGIRELNEKARLAAGRGEIRNDPPDEKQS